MLLGFAAAVLMLGFVAKLAFDRFKVPDFLVLTAAGIAIGPATLDLLPADVLSGIAGASGPFLAVTVAFVMMEAGIHLTLTAGRLATLLILVHTAIAVVLTFVGAFVLVHMVFGFSASSATVIAAATLGPSAVVLASFAPRLALRRETRQALLVEGVVANVIGFFVVISVPGLGSGSADLAVWAGALSALALAVLLASAVGIGWGFALRHLHPKEGVFIATLAVALGVYALAAGPLGGNGAVAAFAFGAVLRRSGGISGPQKGPSEGTEAAADLGRFHTEASFLVRTFFFLYLGLIFAPANLTLSGATLAVVLIVLFLAARLPSCLMLKRVWRLPRPDTLTLEGSIARGLTDVLLVLYGISSGLVPPAEGGPLAAVTVVLLFGSLAVNAAVIVYAERVRASERKAEAPPQEPKRTLD